MDKLPLRSTALARGRSFALRRARGCKNIHGYSYPISLADAALVGAEMPVGISSRCWTDDDAKPSRLPMMLLAATRLIRVRRSMRPIPTGAPNDGGCCIPARSIPAARLARPDRGRWSPLE
jgi:hypothetical protein